MKKGFTLVELLAVLVILAVIATIAVPIVLNLINDSKESADERSIEAYKKAVEQAFYLAEVDNKLDEGYYRGTKTLTNKNTTINVEYTGNDVSCTIIKYTNSKVLIDKCNMGKTPNVTLDEYLLETEYNAKIGDYIIYNPTSGVSNLEELVYESSSEATGSGSIQTFDASSYTGAWQIIGVEDGKIKVLSIDPIRPTKIDGVDNTDNKGFTLKGEVGYINGINELNNIASIYGKGIGAISARSLNIDDLKDIAYGLDITTLKFPDNVSHIQYDSGSISAIGHKVTYKLSEDGTTVIYKSDNGATMSQPKEMFYHYDSQTNKFITVPEAGKEYSLTNSLIYYFPRRLEGYKNSKFYNLDSLLFTDYNYWLANRRDYANKSGFNSYGLYIGLKQSEFKIQGITLTLPSLDTETNEVSIEQLTPEEQNINGLSLRVVAYLSLEDTNSTSTICELKSGEADQIGSKYSCKVNDSTTHDFYLLSTNDEEMNFILDRNICENGELTTATNNCVVKWNSTNINSDSPVNAIKYLDNATSTWTNIDTLNRSYSDEKYVRGITPLEQATTGGYGNIYLFGRVRMPLMKELIDAGCTATAKSCPTWLVNGLQNASLGQELTLGSIKGYWTLSSVSDANTPNNFTRVWNVEFQGYLQSYYNASNERYGVRPVITVPKYRVQ